MTHWTTMARAVTASDDELYLRRRGEIYEIRYNGIELISSFNHQSEDQLALRAMRQLDFAPRRIPIGGLGLGYTTRAILEVMRADAEVHVCELIQVVADWNHDHIGHLAGHPLRDPRCYLHIENVQGHLAHNPDTYDLVLLDTDNGPDFLVRPENTSLHETNGLFRVIRALRPAGAACFWSATASPRFEDRLRLQPQPWHRDDIALMPARVDAMHYL
ncbi:hypothetical protein [Paracoccus benzoatiresistens]|uniref:Spermidine synthase n=1 Tax=Paracoccus benzoatiresistens TaxID=2997341 RepID=A0ABT4JBX3_9RHOB|nr:hypothetical protein [Paracoccus sp. EF6]MCZ0964404.1 hypothetical protein [Paracoccus sp. EF6]